MDMCGILLRQLVNRQRLVIKGLAACPSLPR